MSKTCCTTCIFGRRHQKSTSVSAIALKHRRFQRSNGFGGPNRNGLFAQLLQGPLSICIPSSSAATPPATSPPPPWHDHHYERQHNPNGRRGRRVRDGSSCSMQRTKQPHHKVNCPQECNNELDMLRKGRRSNSCCTNQLARHSCGCKYIHNIHGCQISGLATSWPRAQTFGTHARNPCF